MHGFDLSGATARACRARGIPVRDSSPTTWATRPRGCRHRTPRSLLSSSAAPSGSAAQILVEPVQGVLPGFLGRGLVVAGGCIVVEAVIGPLVDMTLVRHMRLGQGGVEGRPSARDARVELAILRIYRRLDFGRIGSAGLSSIERNRSGKIGAHPHRQLIDNAAAKAKADGAELAGAVRA